MPISQSSIPGSGSENMSFDQSILTGLPIKDNSPVNLTEDFKTVSTERIQSQYNPPQQVITNFNQLHRVDISSIIVSNGKA